jgi:hypothetical protein
MKLSREEELVLRYWIYDEAHFLNGVGPAKRLQVEHQVIPADLATLVAAAIPDLEEQAQAASTAPVIRNRRDLFPAAGGSANPIWYLTCVQ